MTEGKYVPQKKFKAFIADAFTSRNSFYLLFYPGLCFDSKVFWLVALLKVT